MLPFTIASMPDLIPSGSLAQLAITNCRSASDKIEGKIRFAKSVPDSVPPSFKTPENKGFFAVVLVPVGR